MLPQFDTRVQRYKLAGHTVDKAWTLARDDLESGRLGGDGSEQDQGKEGDSPDPASPRTPFGDKKRKVIAMSPEDAEHFKSRIKILAKASKGKSAPLAEQIQWVHRNIEVPVEDIDPVDVPDPGAVALLRWVVLENNRTEFYKGIMVRVLPNRAAIDDREGMKDDGSSVIPTLREILRGVTDHDDEPDE